MTCCSHKDTVPAGVAAWGGCPTRPGGCCRFKCPRLGGVWSLVFRSRGRRCLDGFADFTPQTLVPQPRSKRVDGSDCSVKAPRSCRGHRVGEGGRPGAPPSCLPGPQLWVACDRVYASSSEMSPVPICPHPLDKEPRDRRGQGGQLDRDRTLECRLWSRS